ncbi:DNA cytosine methyltransferase [Microbacterium testaceum]|uniref:DNA cytosine methyltransferase n=1 Tax=Microbacterium testaceum TaxID=2033 RepID=UPI002435B320|nr:DNA cytosine methyltransferase [Microbacterium testaceum]
MSSGDRPIAVDLFCGAGGLSLGLEQAGFDVVAAVEYDPIHAAVHEFNFPDGKTFCADVRNVSGEDIRRGSTIGTREVHLVAGGPPCQGFSMMGRRAIDDPRNALLKEFVRIVLELRPRYFLMENVAGLMAGAHRQLLDEVIEIFEQSGSYRVLTPVRVLQAAEYGSPQSRRRTILLGARKDVAMPSYPDAINTPRTIKGSIPAIQSASPPLGPSVREALAGLPNADDFDELIRAESISGVVFGAGSVYSAKLRGEVLDEADYSRPRPSTGDVLTASRRTVHGPSSRAQFQRTLQGQTEPISRFLRLHSDGLSNTLRAGTGSDRGAYTAPRPIHPDYPRVITVREAARLHGFPDWFRFHTTKWNGFREIGNSVPPHLGRAVGAAILEADRVAPRRMEEILPLGREELLLMGPMEAHRHFGLTERVIPARGR